MSYTALLDSDGRGSKDAKPRYATANMFLSWLVGMLMGCMAIYLPFADTLGGQETSPSPSPSPFMLAIPAAKQLVNEMDTLIGKQFKWNEWDAWHPVMAKYFAENFTYDYGFPHSIDPNPCTLCDLEIPGTLNGLKHGDAPYHGIKSWWSGEHVPWNLAFPSSRFAGGTGFIFAGSEDKVTLTTYAKSVFVSDFKGIPNKPTAAKRRELAAQGLDPDAPLAVTMVDLDFYSVGYDKLSGQKRILINWCDGDFYGMMVQTGRKLLAHTGLPEEKWYPPRTMEGLPAPASEFASPEKTKAANSVVKSMFEKLFLGADTSKPYEEGRPSMHWVDDIFTADSLFYFNPYGIGFAQNSSVLVDKVLRPLIWNAFSNKRIDFDMAFCESHVCGAHGNIVGKHVGDFMGVVPNDDAPEVELRFGCHLILAQEHPSGDLRIRDGYCLFNLIGAVLGMGRNLVSEAQALA